MPWLEDDTYPSGFRWERADAQPVTEILPIIPPPSGLPVGVGPLPRLPGHPVPGGGAVLARLARVLPAPHHGLGEHDTAVEVADPAVPARGDALLERELLAGGASEGVAHPAILPDLPQAGEWPVPEPRPPVEVSTFPPLPCAYETPRPAAPTQENPVKISREPALLYIGLLAPVVQAVAAFVFAVSPGVQGAVNALAVALAAAITAALVRADNLVPAIVGAFQAVLALVLALGIDLTGDQQASVMVAVGAIAAVVVRDRVVAPVPAVLAEKTLAV